MILFLGIAGSGKSTQGHMLAAQLHCPWVSTGNLLREKMDPATQARMLKGEIIDDERTLAVLGAELKRIHSENTECVLDGSPRTLHQAEWLAAKAKKGEISITGVIHLTIDKDTARKRLLTRKRPDDHEQAIIERFREYEEAIKPVLEYLKSQGFKTYDIDGNKSPEQVDAAICKVLGV